MNTHFDFPAEHREKRIEALRSLSIDNPAPITQSPRRTPWRLVLPACFCTLILAVAGGVAVLRPDRFAIPASAPQSAGQAAERPAPAGAALASRAVPAKREITGSGFVVAPHRTAIFAKYEGRITRIAVTPGDRVETGEVLVTMEDAGARFALAQARSMQAQADLTFDAREIDLAQARARLERTKALATRNVATMQALEDAQAAAEQASNALKQARQARESAALAIRIAGERMAELTVRAPFGGIVTRLDAAVGDTILARLDTVRESQSLLTVTDTANLVIDADVAETAIAALKPGLRGQAVLDAFPDRPFTVSLLRIAPAVSVEKGTVSLRLSLDDPPEGIRPNMAARIRLILDDTGEDTQ